MLFNSTTFLLFLAVVVAVYLALRHRAQNLWLLGASYFFYAAWDWRFCLLILLSTVVDWICARRIATRAEPRARKRWLWVSLGVNLSVLGFFKYWNFFADSLRALFAALGLEASWHVTGLILPVGISFYTFQSLSYTIDVYRGRLQPAASLAEYALFVSFFPQLVAGPIERAAHLLPQIRAPRTVTAESFASGCWLVFLGLYKKIFVADQLARYVDPVFAADAGRSGADVLLGCVLFGLQIYADFAGYTDVARGAARMLGFDLMVNFRAPYLSRNLQEFWSRWHISLTSWIRDYLFYPLALNRRWNQLLGPGGLAIVTMTIMGLWHGAAWTFVLWGLYHGVLLAAYGKLKPHLYTHTHRLEERVPWLWTPARVVFTFLLGALGTILFRSADIEVAGALVGDLLGELTLSRHTLPSVRAAVWIDWLVLVLDVIEYRTGDHEPVLRWPWWARRLLQAWMLACIAGALLAHRTTLGVQFQYFQF